MISQRYTKTMCMVEICVEHAHQKNTHVFDATAGKVNSSFGYILKGSTLLCSLGKTIEAPQGSLIYIPDGVRYRSMWTGNPEIEQYCIHMSPNKLSRDTSGLYYPIQVVKELSTPRTGQIFEEIYRLFSTGDRIDRLEALALYFQFYAEAAKHMEQQPQVGYNAIVADAIAYIDENYMNAFSIQDLADRCHVSASHVYHLFKKTLGMTPTQYINEIRIEKAASKIRHSDIKLDEIACITGFSSTSYFREVFKAHTGITPAQYRTNLATEKG